MPIRANKPYQDESEEQRSLLQGDEEQGGFQGNGIEGVAESEAQDRQRDGQAAGGAKGQTKRSNGDYGTMLRNGGARPGVRSHSKYRAIWERASHTAVRSRHRLEISEKLKDFDTHEFTSYRRSEESIKRIEQKGLRTFYKEQNEKLNDWVEVDTIVSAMSEDILQSFEPQDLDHDGVAETGGKLQLNKGEITALLPADEQQRRQKEARQARWAININVATNVLLVAVKAIATIFSSSLSLLASLADSVLDLLMTLIIWSTSKLVSAKSFKLSSRYPVGRRRLQPLGTLCFSVIMVVSFLQILQESVTRLMGDDHEVPKLPAVAIASMASTIGLKGAIWFGCRWQSSSQVQALAQDCKTDVIFNTASLLFPAIGYYANIWWLDSVGAGLLSIYIVLDWAHTCLEHVSRLSGGTVSDATMRKVFYMAWRFHPVVEGYKNLKAYHAGDGVWVECDVLLSPNTDLRHAHDLAELIQYCFEGLNEVDRAFVSVDYAEQGPTGHASTD